MTHTRFVPDGRGDADPDTYDEDSYDEDGDDVAAPVPRRRRPGSVHRRRVAGVVAGLVVLAVALTWVVAFSSLLGVRSLDVRGNHLITAAQITRAADIPDGTPLVRVDVAAATRRIEQLPEINSAQVSTSFPSAVIITVTERSPVGWVRTGGRAVLVDRTGRQYRTVAAAPYGLPRLMLPAHGDSPATAAAVAQVAAALPVGLRAEVRSIDALDPDAITLVLTGQRVVRWGDAGDSAVKAQVVPALLRAGDQHIDVTDPFQPFSY